MKLECLSGEIDAAVGQRFTEDKNEWEIVGFEDDGSVNRDGLPGVSCRAITEMPDIWRRWVRADGTVVWCGDSVAAVLLTQRDGRPRSSRGHLLTTPPAPHA